MSKIPDYATSLLPQEVIDMLDDMKLILNFGKVQLPVITSGSGPTWTGRQGEQVLQVVGNTLRLYVCTSDLSTNWSFITGA